MLGTTNWQNQDFLKVENYKKILAAANDCWSFNEEKDAFYLYKNVLKDKIDFLYKLSDKQLADKYRQSVLKLVYVALPRLATEEIAKWFQNDLLGLLFLEGDLLLKDKIRKHLAQEVISERDGLKKTLIRAMENNKQPLGDQRVDNSIGSWLKDYRLFLEDSKNDRKLAQAEYLLRKVDILGLKEKEIVSKLLNFYDFLHLSSFTIEGNEDSYLMEGEDGYYGLYKGEIFKINFVEAGLSEGSRPQKENFSRQEKGVNETEEKLDKQLVLGQIFNNFLNAEFIAEAWKVKSKLAGNDLKTLRNHFYQAVNAGNKEEVIAALFAITEAGKLAEAFGGDERFVGFWGDYLAKNNPAEKTEFVNDPANARDLARFLQYILEGRLKMKRDEAAMIGVLISNMAREAHDLDYETLAYGEMESGEFRWNV